VRITFPVDAPPAAWAALADPAALAAALPGCRSVTVADDGRLRVVADLAVASVRGLWAGTVVRVDADAVRVVGSGAPGTVDLVVRADAARATLTVEGTVDGPLVTVGSAVLAAAVRKLTEAALAAATNPTTTRGDGFRPGEGEAIGSGSGTHDLGPRSTEPMTSEPQAEPVEPAGPRGSAGEPPRGRRAPAGVAAAAGVVVVVLLGRRRRTRRRSA
jgi:carbon monoxide dehydrogenase subunit G